MITKFKIFETVSYSFTINDKWTKLSLVIYGENNEYSFHSKDYENNITIEMEDLLYDLGIDIDKKYTLDEIYDIGKKALKETDLDVLGFNEFCEIKKPKQYLLDKDLEKFNI